MLMALQFLTIIPVKVSGKLTDREVGSSALFYPLVGALQGLLLLIAGLLLARIFSPEIVAGFLIAIAIISNGGFHLDGLADTFDALAVKSSGNRAKDLEKRLAVMKDSMTGAIGVVAIVTVILLKFVLLRSILSFGMPATAFLVVFLMPVFSKWIMVPAMYHGISARKDGLGRLFIEGASAKTLIISSLLALFIFCIITVAHLAVLYGVRGFIILTLLPAGYIMAVTAAGICARIFGGLTGDTLGAISELSEIFYLTGVYIWLQHFI
jgi:adenosylcobinamide-GDP ribazoletransferase